MRCPQTSILALPSPPLTTYRYDISPSTSFLSTPDTCSSHTLRHHLIPSLRNAYHTTHPPLISYTDLHTLAYQYCREKEGVRSMLRDTAVLPERLVAVAKDSAYLSFHFDAAGRLTVPNPCAHPFSKVFLRLAFGSTPLAKLAHELPRSPLAELLPVLTEHCNTTPYGCCASTNLPIINQFLGCACDGDSIRLVLQTYLHGGPRSHGRCHRHPHGVARC